MSVFISATMKSLKADPLHFDESTATLCGRLTDIKGCVEERKADGVLSEWSTLLENIHEL